MMCVVQTNANLIISSLVEKDFKINFNFGNFWLVFYKILSNREVVHSESCES